MKKISKLMAHLVLLVSFGFLLVGCKPAYPHKPAVLTLAPSLSSDGKLLAVLSSGRSDDARRLHIKWLDREGPWLEMSAPKYINSIQFGLTGYELLFTSSSYEPKGVSQLSRWDVSQLEKAVEVLYEGSKVQFPVEIKPGQVLARICPKPRAEDCKRGVGTMQAVIEDGKATVIKETQSLLYRQPNIVEGGFFWLEDEYFSEKRGDPARREISSFALPGGKAPYFDASRFDAQSRSFRCDRNVQRCLLHYLINPLTHGAYVYGFKIFEGSTTCTLAGIKGWHDGFSVTPDGRSAVLSFSHAFHEPRHLVILSFTPGQCEPTTIQHIQFEEKLP